MKILFGVDYKTEKGSDNSTFEIFETIQEGENFIKKCEKWQKPRRFIADFDKSLVYREDFKNLNYEDKSGLYINYKKIN